MNDEKLIEALREKEEFLQGQLEVTRKAIVAYGGITPKTRKLPEPTSSSSDEETPESRPVKAKRGRPRGRKRSSHRGVTQTTTEGYIIEILKEKDKPMSVKNIHKGLKGLGFKYKKQSVYAYLSPMVKKGLVVRVDNGVYVHREYVPPTSYGKKILSIREVSDYFKFKKEVSTKELNRFFVETNQMEKKQMYNEILKLERNKLISRVSHGVYRWIGKA